MIFEIEDDMAKKNVPWKAEQNLIKKYNTVRTSPKSNKKIQHCQNISKI
jgi:hypothetical protein